MDRKYEKIFVYAFFKADRENGVHEDLCVNKTIAEALDHAKALWIDADDYRVSDIQLGAPYHFLFAKDGSAKNIREKLALCEMSDIELEGLVSHLDEINKKV